MQLALFKGDLAILLAALLLDALIGDPPALWRRLPHPVVLIGRAVVWLEALLSRGSGRRRRWSGAVMAFGLAALALATGAVVTALRLSSPWGWALELALSWALLTQKSLFLHVRAVAQGLEKGGLPGGRWAVARLASQDPESMDGHGVARAAIEALADQFAAAVVAPVFWYVLAGFPGMLLFKTMTVADHRLDPDGLDDFALTTSRMADLFAFFPARLAALLLVAAMPFVPGGRPVAAWRIMWRDHDRHPAANQGWPEAALAGGLDLALAGPRRERDRLVPDQWIGDGRARAGIFDIHRALMSLAVGCLLTAGLVTVCLLFRLGSLGGWVP